MKYDFKLKKQQIISEQKFTKISLAIFVVTVDSTNK